MAAPARTTAAARSDEQRLAQFFADDERRENALDPLSALVRGEPVDPATFSLLFTDALDRRMLASAQTGLAALATINRARLSPERRISYDVFLYNKREELAWLQPDIRALTEVRPLNHFGGLHVDFPSLMAPDGLLSYRNEADYRSALALAGAFPAVLDNAVAEFRQGMATGVVESRLTVRNMIGQIDALLAQPIDQSPFTSPVREFPDGVPEASRQQLRAAFTQLARDRIYPAYRACALSWRTNTLPSRASRSAFRR